MIRNWSVSHVHIHASIIFSSIITNSDHFCLFKSITTNSDPFQTLLVSYFTVHMQLSSTNFKFSFHCTKWMSHFLPYLFTSSKKILVLVWPLLLLFNQPFILYLFPFSFFSFWINFILYLILLRQFTCTCLHRFLG